MLGVEGTSISSQPIGANGIKLIDRAAETGAKPMGFIWQRSRMIAIAVVIVLGAGAIAFARPHAIYEPVLGTEWQCSRAAFVVTCDHR
jgi:hypothetical protein